MKPKARILIVEDETDMLRGLAKMLSYAGYSVDCASTGTDAIVNLEKKIYDVVITDLKLPGPDGLAILRKMKETSPESVGIVITGYGTVEAAVEAMKLGAYDFISKPFDMHKIKVIVRNALEQSNLISENRYLKERIQDEWQVENIVGKSPEMIEVFDAVRKVAPTDTTVLILGESGTGKELIARYIHHLSSRKDRLFTAINCSVLRDMFLESELFGHVKGAYTGAVSSKRGLLEIAHRGSFFLDEVAEVCVPVQAKLLRVLEDKTFMRLGGTDTISVDIRLIVATNKDLDACVKNGDFRDDLFYRLNTFTITLPPLRERTDDVPLLAYHFLKKHCKELGKRIHEIGDDAMDALISYNWPGNVRELDKIIERGVILENSEIMTLENLPEKLASNSSPEAGSTEKICYTKAKKRLLEEFDRNYAVNLLIKHNGNVTHASEEAGMDRANFQRLMRKTGVKSEQFQE